MASPLSGRVVNNELIAFESFAKLRRSKWPVTPILEGGLPNNDQIKIIGVDPFTLSKNSNFYKYFFEKRDRYQEFLINNRLAFASPETINKISKLNLNLELVKTESEKAEIIIVKETIDSSAIRNLEILK